MKDKKYTYQTIIIGGGLSGLSAAHFLKKRDNNHKLLLLEKNRRLGGSIWSFRKNGLIAEPGAHGFLDNCPETQTLLQQTKLDQECEKASLEEFVRYVFHEGRLKKIEQSPLKILTSPLISPIEKIGVLRDIFRKPLPGEPSVATWCEYHFGTALLPYLDAVFTGTYAGDIERLAIDSVMPGVRAMEKEKGSIIRGLFAKMKATQRMNKNNRKGRTKRLSLPAMTSFPQGMGYLIERLAEGLSENEVCAEETATQITRQENLWRIESNKNNSSKTSYYAQNLILALPINATLSLIRNSSLEAIQPAPMMSIPEASIANIAITLPQPVKIPSGFGFLVPEQEKRFILGALFSSNMFAGRAAEGAQLVEILIGGRRHSERLQHSEEELIHLATRDFLDILKLNCKTLSAQLLPRNNAIPQLEQGSPALLQWKEEVMANNKNLFIGGFGWNGIGVNDMIKTSWKTVEQLIAGGDDEQQPVVKPLYF